MVFFTKQLLIGRSFELISLYLSPYHSLNVFLGPSVFDSKPSRSQSGSNRDGPSRRIILPIAPQNLVTRNHTSPEPAPRNESGIGKSLTSVGEFVRKHCPSLFRAWEPTWWLNSGHLQTVWSSVGDFSDVDHVQYERALLQLPDGGMIAVDFTEPPYDGDKKINHLTPIVVVLPGLTGGSQAPYVRSLLTVICGPKSNGGLGYRGAVVNSRGCGNVPLVTPRISAGSADDLGYALLYIRSLYPNAPIFAVGFSLGATVLMKYLGEEGKNSVLKGGCVIACPWDLRKNSESLESRFLHRQVYSRALAQSYLAMLHRSLPTLKIPPSSPFHAHLPLLQTLQWPTFTEVNTHFASIIGGAPPAFPHPSVDDFYTWASCVNEIHGVRVPLLCLNADDDPIVAELPYEEVRKANERGDGEGGWVAMVVTRGGGHLGWFNGEAKRRWISTPIVEWIRALAEEVVWPESKEAKEDRGTCAAGSKGDEPHTAYQVLSVGKAPEDTSIPGAMAGL